MPWRPRRKQTRQTPVTPSASISDETLRDAPPEVRDQFASVSPAPAASPEAAFIRTLLEAEGDEEEVVSGAADRLPGGEPEPVGAPLSAVIAVLKDDVGQLERSVRKWAIRPVSRNYVGYLREQVLS